MDQVGLWQLPHGAAMYAYATRDNTTTDLTPQEIHEIGLKEVKRIRAEMQAIIDKLAFAVPSPNSPSLCAAIRNFTSKLRVKYLKPTAR